MKEVPLNSSTNPPHADVDVLWLTTFFALREQIDFFPLASSESSDDISTAFVLLQLTNRVYYRSFIENQGHNELIFSNRVVLKHYKILRKIEYNMKCRFEGCADMVSEDNFGFRNFMIVIVSSRLNWFSNCLYQKVKKGIKTSARRGQQPHRDRERRLPGSPSFSRQHGHGSVAYRDQLGNVQYIYFSHFLGNF